MRRRLPEARDARQAVAGFRCQLYRCLTARRGELFDSADAVLGVDGPDAGPGCAVAGAGHRLGHGAVSDGLNVGRTDSARRSGVTAVRWPNRRILLAADVRPDAAGRD